MVSNIITEEKEDENSTCRKDENNAKRRIYEAFNVFIAAGLLRKNETLGKQDEPATDLYQL
jgi:hypothetical protein